MIWNGMKIIDKEFEKRKNKYLKTIEE